MYDRARWIDEHPGWTFEMYDHANAGDILFQREYAAMNAPLTETEPSDV